MGIWANGKVKGKRERLACTLRLYARRYGGARGVCSQAGSRVQKRHRCGRADPLFSLSVAVLVGVVMAAAAAAAVAVRMDLVRVRVRVRVS